MQALLRHDWPGNIRELRNTIERLVVFAEDGAVNFRDLPAEVHDPEPSAMTGIPQEVKPEKTVPFTEQVQDFERKLITQELEKTDGNKVQCAKNLEITRATLYNKMHKLNISF